MWVLAMISLYLKKVGRELSPTRRAKCNKRKRPQKRATSFLCMYLVSILKKTTRYCITMYYLWVVVRDYGACISSMTHQHGQYACWMSTGRKNGLMLKHTHETQTRTSLFRYTYLHSFMYMWWMQSCAEYGASLSAYTDLGCMRVLTCQPSYLLFDLVRRAKYNKRKGLKTEQTKRLPVYLVPTEKFGALKFRLQ